MSPLIWGADSLQLPGQKCSGDRHLVCETPEGALVAAVDGLGHGEQAAAAAGIAVSLLENNADMNVISLVQYCHDKLKDTRGVVMSLASINTRVGICSWIGVGNVSGLLVRGNENAAREGLLLRGGVVGGQLPRLKGSILAIAPGDMLIFSTDGVNDIFTKALPTGIPPAGLARWILTHFANGEDDALALVVRYQSG